MISAHKVVAPSVCEGAGLSVAEIVLQMERILGSRSDARDLLALMHDQPRHFALVSGEVVLSAEQAADASRAATERAAGAPLEYAARRAAFRNFSVMVDERVLIPRPETEILVDIVLDATRALGGGIAVDVGTGSGVIAIALALEGRFDRLIGTDISRDAVDVARINAGANFTQVDFRHGSLLTPVPERGLTAVVSNPPYIAFDEAVTLPNSVRNWEPSAALFSGHQGMDTSRQLVRQAAIALAPSGVLALEVDSRRASLVAECCASDGGYENVRVMLDLTGRERFVVATRREIRG